MMVAVLVLLSCLRGSPCLQARDKALQEHKVASEQLQSTQDKLATIQRALAEAR